MEKINYLKILIILLGILFIRNNLLANGSPSLNNKDSCWLFFVQDSYLKIKKKIYLPLYINDDERELLGWFHFSNTEILYISPVYKSKTLVYKKASKVQVLFNKKNKYNENCIYYFGRFSHCKFSLVGSEHSYIIKVAWINPPPSHADVLKEIELSKDLKIIKMKISFMGSNPQSCSINITKYQFLQVFTKRGVVASVERSGHLQHAQ